MAFTEHGYLGMEAKTIKAILSWIRTGAVPAGVSERENFLLWRRDVWQV
jgi:hypothetical protein